MISLHNLHPARRRAHSQFEDLCSESGGGKEDLLGAVMGPGGKTISTARTDHKSDTRNARPERGDAMLYRLPLTKKDPSPARPSAASVSPTARRRIHDGLDRGVPLRAPF